MKDQITGHTRLGGLLGSPVAHSISPMMHNAAFAHLGIDWVYLCFDTGKDKLGQVVEAMRSLNVFGFNVTMPDKVRILPYLDGLSKEAEMIGAVNTVKNENGKLIGYNTDGMGFLQSLTSEGIRIKGQTVSLIGAGGAGNAIATQAAIDGAKELHLLCRRGRSWEHAQSLVRQISEQTSCRADLTDLSDTEQIKAHLQDSALLINASSAGMAPDIDVTPIRDPSLLSPDLIVTDVIYNPAKTRLLREAEQRGCRIQNGMYMLLYQGAASFRIWTGQDMPVEMIRQRFFS